MGPVTERTPSQDLYAHATAVRGALDKAVGGTLQPGEQIVAFAEGLMKVVLQLFNKCAVVLTDRRLIMLSPSWPWGYRIDGSLPRSQCAIMNLKRKFDGSSLLILKHPGGVTCLYFSRHWQPQTDLLVAALAPPTEPAYATATDEGSQETPPLISHLAEEPPLIVDRILLTQEFHGLEEEQEEEE